MGHSKLATTERYLHAKPRQSDVARLDRAFAGRAAEADPLAHVSEDSESSSTGLSGPIEASAIA